MKSATTTNGERRRKYHLDNLIPMLRKAAALRNEMLALGFTDNGGAIHSAERIVYILGLCLNYPGLGHINNLRHHKGAIFSVEAQAAHRSGTRVLIEHFAPIRDLTRKTIEKISEGASDAELAAFVRNHYQLVLLTPIEALRLNRLNRSKMSPDRLSSAGIRIAGRRAASVAFEGRRVDCYRPKHHGRARPVAPGCNS
jgi:hypothetical protein